MLSYEAVTKNSPWDAERVEGGREGERGDRGGQREREEEEGRTQNVDQCQRGTLTLKLDVRDKVGMGRDGVDTRLFAKVPQPHGIIITSSSHMVAVGTEIHS